MISLHDHNEREQSERLSELLQAGENIALVSDAGTPLISDPGFHLVRSLRDQGITVISVPGPSALIAALSVSGLPTDRFIFEGFLPAKAGARKEYLQGLVQETATLVFYESSHRILSSVTDMVEIFGDDREAVVVRELTKKFETIIGNSLGEILACLQRDQNQQKGEFVVIVRGISRKAEKTLDTQVEKTLSILLEELPVKQASALCSKITGAPKNELYKRALELSGKG
jgi:16S rRNA (cytidine1402-2'-O)-methyltransferase